MTDEIKELKEQLESQAKEFKAKLKETGEDLKMSQNQYEKDIAIHVQKREFLELELGDMK